jgi:hypothetical protein
MIHKHRRDQCLGDAGGRVSVVRGSFRRSGFGIGVELPKDIGAIHGALSVLSRVPAPANDR